MARQTKLKRFAIRSGSSGMPHWRIKGATYAVTLRVIGPLPLSIQVELERRQSTVRSGRRSVPRMPLHEQELLERVSDPAFRAKWFHSDERAVSLELPLARIVEETMLRRHDIDYELLTWCVMTSHVHAIVRPHDGQELADIVGAWKSCSARVINRTLQRKGSVWIPNFYNRIIRSEQSMTRGIRYVLENPIEIGQHDWPVRGTHGRGSLIAMQSPSMQHVRQWCR